MPLRAPLRTPQRLPLRLRIATGLVAAGVMLSAPFTFVPKVDALGAIALAVLMVGLALAGRPGRARAPVVAMHAVGAAAAALLFAYHGLDTLYLKFMLSIAVSLQLTLVDTRVLGRLKRWMLVYGSRGAVLAIASFVVYFAVDAAPFFRTELGDGRSIPFFGLTNINFGFENPELLVFARPAFLFDEPGQFAHFALLLLALVGLGGPLALRRWRREVRMLVFAALATFSLAFVTIAGAYLLPKVHRWRTWLFVAALGAAVAAMSQHPLVETLLQRLQSSEAADSEQLLTGDNRSREVQMAAEAFASNPLWGAGWTRAEQTIGHFAANPLGPLGYSGLMAVLLYLPLVARWVSCLRRALGFEQRWIVLLVGLFFAQRPYFYFPLFMLMMEIMQRQLGAMRRRAATS